MGSASAQRFVGPWSVAALVILTCAAVLPATFAAPLGGGAVCLVAGAAYLAVTTYGSYRVERMSSDLAFALVFAAQLALCAVAVVASEARASLIVLGTVSQAVLYLRPRWAALVVVIGLAGTSASFLWVAPERWLAIQGMFGFAAAGMFVIAFSWMARRQHEVRGEAQRLANELEVANARLVDYAAQAESFAAERERTRIAREIHDTLGHCLTATHVQLEAARLVIGDGNDRARVAIGHAKDLTVQALRDVRRSVTALRDFEEPPLDVRLAALTARLSDIEARVTIEGEARALAAPTELALFRVAQEALTNVQRHARARRVDVVLRYALGTVELVVEDDGVGAASSSGTTAPEPGHYGLAGMMERVEEIGGRLSLPTTAGAGFRVRAEVPG